VVGHVLHHPRSGSRVVGPLSNVFHARVPEDVHLVMRDPSGGPIQNLCRFVSSRHPDVLIIVPGSDLEVSQPRLVNAPVIHLEVDVGMIISAPGSFDCFTPSASQCWWERIVSGGGYGEVPP
jgi:hypothetical protein